MLYKLLKNAVPTAFMQCNINFIHAMQTIINYYTCFTIVILIIPYKNTSNYIVRNTLRYIFVIWLQGSKKYSQSQVSFFTNYLKTIISQNSRKTIKGTKIYYVFKTKILYLFNSYCLCTSHNFQHTNLLNVPHECVVVPTSPLVSCPFLRRRVCSPKPPTRPSPKS